MLFRNSNFMSRISAFISIIIFISFLSFSTSVNTAVVKASSDVQWDTDIVLEQKGEYPFASINEYNNLTINDNVKVFSKGVSQLVIKVNGTLTLGKNVVICVRNGYYQFAPTKSIAGLTSETLKTLGSDGGGFRLYDNMFGQGGDGGNGGNAGDGFLGDYMGTRFPGRGGNGGFGGSGGFGGGLGGSGGLYGGPGANIGTKVGRIGSAGSKGDNNGEGSLSGGATGIGKDGLSAEYGAGGGGGGGNGGRGGNGGGQDSAFGLGNGGGGGGGGGYGGGVLTIIAKKIVFDTNNPPLFITSGQVGGKGGKSNGENGENGQGGLLIINAQDYDYSLKHWNLGKKIYENQSYASENGGHGNVTGNPQKVFINGIEIIHGDEVVIKDDLPTAIKKATTLLKSKKVGEAEGNVSQSAKDAFQKAIKNAIKIRDGKSSKVQKELEVIKLNEATQVFNKAIIKAFTINIGDYVQMGKYYDEPILWRCVEIDENGPLMLSDKIITLKAFDAGGNHKYLDGTDQADSRETWRVSFGSNLWETSNIRSWLNSTATAGNVTWLDGCPPIANNIDSGYNAYACEKGFLAEGNFTESERKIIKTVTQKSLLNSVDAKLSIGGTDAFKTEGYTMETIVGNYDSAYYHNVTDKVFLLDVMQIYKVYQNGDTLGTSYYKGKLTQKAIDNSEYGGNALKNTQYMNWTRSPGSDALCTICVGVGDDDATFNPRSYYGIIGVRPAFYMNVSAFNFKSGEGTDIKPYIGD